MSNNIYQLLNILFFVFHTVFTLFNIVGWIFPRTRKLHLITVLLTACSWGVLGYWFGWGYCFCTDWHWQIRESLGYYDNSDSYIHFLILKITGWNPDIDLINHATLIVFLFCFFASLIMNIKQIKNKRNSTH